MIEHIAACVQFWSEPNAIARNVDKCCHWLERAVKEHEARLVVFPESVTTGFDPNMPVEEFYEMLSPIPGDATFKLQALCKELKVHAVIGLYEQGKNKNEVLNSSILIDDAGEIRGNYRKTHPFPTERLGGGGWTTPGTETVVVDTKLGKIGMIICYDGDFPELCRVLALKGAQIITRPSALMRSFEIWEMVNKARAYDNHVYFLAPNAVGPDASNSFCFGHSMIISPIAQTLALARGQEEIISAKLDPDPIKYITYGSKAPMMFDHLEDRNVSVYKEILQEGKSSFEPYRRIAYR
ncbi:MAG: carbon-nitrogen hydrolase family protein [Defluviitaleaceae bacterium]|nr:carbon-nitrogen hydrolase family protein [Defluviitaleaceae bacterium]